MYVGCAKIFRPMNSRVRASFVLVLFTLLQGTSSQELFSAEKFVCILGGTGTRHAIPVLAATFGLYPKYGKFAVPGLGGGYAHMLRAFIFPKYGLDKGPKQPTILSAGDTPSALNGVVNRQYDAALASYENYVAFRKRGLKALVVPEDVNVKWYTGLITLEKKIKERRRAMIQFIKAQIEAVSIIKKDPTKARAALKNYFRSSDDDLMAEYQNYLAVKLPLVTRVGTDNIKSLLLTSTNPAANNAKPEEFIDNSLVEEILREGFVKQFEQ